MMMSVLTAYFIKSAFLHKPKTEETNAGSCILHGCEIVESIGPWSAANSTAAAAAAAVATALSKGKPSATGGTRLLTGSSS